MKWTGKARGAAAAMGLAVALSCWTGAADAEVGTLRLGKQYGLPYLQLLVMENQKLIEKHAKENGIDLDVEWRTLGGPAPLNDAIISGGLDIASVGMSNLVTIWSKTHRNIGIRAVCGLNAMPLILVTHRADLKSLKDFGPGDRIALPSVKVSMHAILLEMAAAKAFGEDQFEKLDPLTVSMGHPDATAAVLSGGAAVSSHFSSAPFQNRELSHAGIHAVISSYDILGGAHSVGALIMTKKFHDNNPTVVKSFLDAMEEATDLVKNDKERAAAVYIATTGSQLTKDELVKILEQPEYIITMEPLGIRKIAEFMHEHGLVRDAPDDWQDYYFDDAKKYMTH